MHRILGRPMAGQHLKTLSIRLVHPSQRRFHANLKRVSFYQLFHSLLSPPHLCKRIRQQALHGQQYLGYRQRQTPIMLDNVDGHVAVPRNVWVDDLGEEPDGGRKHGIELGHHDVQKELAALVRTARRPHNGRREVRQLIINGHKLNAVCDLIVLVLQPLYLPVIVPVKLHRALLGHVDEAGVAEARVH